MLKDTTRCHQWARTQDLSMNVLQRSPMLYHYVTGVQINQLIDLHVLRICCTSHFCIWLMLARMATLLGKSWSLALHACYNILCNVLSCSFFFLNGVYTGFIFLSYFPSGLRGATPHKHRHPYWFIVRAYQSALVYYKNESKIVLFVCLLKCGLFSQSTIFQSCLEGFGESLYTCALLSIHTKLPTIKYHGY